MEEKSVEAVIVAAVSDIPEFEGRIMPIMAPKDTPHPFVVYISDGTTEDDTLGGWIGSFETEIEVNVLAKRYKQMKTLAKKVVDRIKQIPDLCIVICEDSPEKYEEAVKAYRKAINLKIMH